MIKIKKLMFSDLKKHLLFLRNVKKSSKFLEKDFYYKLLKADRASSTKDIKLMYKRIIKEIHPDLNPEQELNRETFRYF